jgi:hypothetical protein
MYLIELIHGKRMVDKKIAELEAILHHKSTDDITKALLDAVDDRQNKVLSICSANHKSYIKIGDTKVDVSTALIIRNTIQQKIDILTSLINDGDSTLDKLELMVQRDSYHEQLVLLNIGILKNDLSVEIE